MRLKSLFASVAAGAVLGTFASAEAQTPFDWSGFYAGIHGGVLTGDVTVHEDSYSLTGGNISGTVVGVLAGYNFPTTSLPPFMFGVEADFGWANVHGNNNNLGPVSFESDSGCDYFSYAYDLQWDAHLRARVAAPMGRPEHHRRLRQRPRRPLYRRHNWRRPGRETWAQRNPAR
jgi:hypothetical protein